MATKAEFVDSIYTAALSAGIPEPQARLAAAQAALESNYGKSAPGNNYFGMKAGSSWSGPVNNLSTKEEVGGKLVSTKAKFRAYETPEESLSDWWDRLQVRWPDAAAAESYDDAVSGLNYGKKGGYATDTDYGTKLNYAIARLPPRPPEDIPGGTALDALAQFGDDVTAPTSMAYSTSLPSPAPLTSVLEGESIDGRGVYDPYRKSPTPAPIAPYNRVQAEAYSRTYKDSMAESANARNGVQPISEADRARLASSGSNRPVTLQTLDAPPLDAASEANIRSSLAPTMDETRAEQAQARKPSSSSSSTPAPISPNVAASYQTRDALARQAAATAAPTTKVVANPEYAKWLASSQGQAAAVVGDTRGEEIAASRAGLVMPPAPPKTITITTPAAPAANPIGDALGWLGNQAGQIGSQAMGTVQGVGAAIPGAIDTAKDNLVNGIMMSPEARSPFINGAIGAIGQNGREYLGNGMTSALRLNHDTGEFERYTRRIAVPTGKVAFEDYDARKIGGSKFTESIGGGSYGKGVGPMLSKKQKLAASLMIAPTG